MDITIKCKKCGCTKGYLRYGDIHTGLYCSKCNNWIKWVSKNEISILESNESNIDESIEEIIDIENLKKQRNDLNEQINNYYKKQVEKDIANNMGYIGKTFKRPITKEIMSYYKILDVVEDNQYIMKALVFSLPIKSFMHKNSYAQTALLHIESISSWFCNSMSDFEQYEREIDSYTEISNDEYKEAFNTWLEKIGDIINNE